VAPCNVDGRGQMNGDFVQGPMEFAVLCTYACGLGHRSCVVNTRRWVALSSSTRLQKMTMTPIQSGARRWLEIEREKGSVHAAAAYGAACKGSSTKWPGRPCRGTSAACIRGSSQETSSTTKAKITIQDDAVRCIQRGVEKASSAQIEGSRDEARAIIFNIPIMIHTSAARLATGPATSDARA